MSRAAWRAINRLRDARDEIEMALRPPGDRPTMSRTALERIRDSIAAAGLAIRHMAEERDDG